MNQEARKFREWLRSQIEEGVVFFGAEIEAARAGWHARAKQEKRKK